MRGCWTRFEGRRFCERACCASPALERCPERTTHIASHVRREDKSRWERRAPLAPIHVKHLTRNGVRVIVQPSNVRICTDHEYQEAGA